LSECRPFEQAVAETLRHNQLLDCYCTDTCRDPRQVVRSVVAYRLDPPPFTSVGAIEEFASRYCEIGYDASAAPEQEVVLERVAATVIPAL